MRGVAFAPRETVRVALIGCGGRGRGMLGELLAVQGVEIVSVFDVSEESAQKAVAAVVKKERPAPQMVVGGDVRQVLDPDVIDLAYIATPWLQHVPYAVAAMEAGVHAAVEVPAAVTLDECWELVETSERTRRHCVQLENCCYGEMELMMIHLAQLGKLGTLTHGEALQRRLSVMDSTAFSLCQDNRMPIIVFDFFAKDSLRRVVLGERVGTLVTPE